VLTPPVGGLLFITSIVARVPLARRCATVAIPVGALGVLVLLTLFPALSSWLRACSLSLKQSAQSFGAIPRKVSVAGTLRLRVSVRPSGMRRSHALRGMLRRPARGGQSRQTRQRRSSDVIPGRTKPAAR
jgi:hypothetical protein